MGNKIAYFIENYRIHHEFSHLNKAIKQIEQAAALSSERVISLLIGYGHSF